MIIAIDFDGTCVTHEFPEIGEDIGAIPVLKQIVGNGHKLILSTMRSDNPRPKSSGKEVDYTRKYLTEAITWFDENDITLYGINENPTQKEWTDSSKVFANFYIGDDAIGCPLVYGNRPYVDWNKLQMLLRLKGIL